MLGFSVDVAMAGPEEAAEAETLTEMQRLMLFRPGALGLGF